MTNYNDGKIHGWNGGECPVHPLTVVEYWLRDSGQDKEAADNLRWGHKNEFFDIIAFRVVNEYVEPIPLKVLWVNEYHTGYMIFDSEEAARDQGARGFPSRVAVKYQEMKE